MLDVPHSENDSGATGKEWCYGRYGVTSHRIGGDKYGDMPDFMDNAYGKWQMRLSMDSIVIWNELKYRREVLNTRARTILELTHFPKKLNFFFETSGAFAKTAHPGHCLSLQNCAKGGRSKSRECASI